MKQEEIGVIGTGFVGSSVIKWFKKCAFYSKSKGSFEAVDKKKFIFLCLPTPYKKGKQFDISALDENIRNLSSGKNIIIKSTVLPGTTEMLARKYPMHRFFFNPEFLKAKTAYEDFITPDRQIVGYVNHEDRLIATEILKELPDADYEGICEAKEAEMTKLMGNCFLATKVVFANEFYDYCKDKGIDYKVVSMMVKLDKRIGNTHLDIFDDDHRGYSGFCFPKDMGAAIEDSGSELLKKANEINDELLSKST